MVLRELTDDVNFFFLNKTNLYKMGKCLKYIPTKSLDI